MTVKYITSAAEFEATVVWNETPESTTLEFKRAYVQDPAKVWKVELRKDVAALANAQGGTILVGVDEGKNASNITVAMGLVSDPDITALTVRLLATVASGIFPRPAVTPYTLGVKGPDGQSTEIVALCIEPMADGVAAVNTKTDQDEWRFWIRDAVGAKPLGFTEVMKRMDSKTRRLLLRAEELGFKQGSAVRICSLVTYQREATSEERMMRLAVRQSMPRVREPDAWTDSLPNVDATVVALTDAQFGLELSTPVGSYTVNIPFDVVRTLWRIDTSLIGVALDCEILVGFDRSALQFFTR